MVTSPEECVLGHEETSEPVSSEDVAYYNRLISGRLSADGNYTVFRSPIDRAHDDRLYNLGYVGDMHVVVEESTSTPGETAKFKGIVGKLARDGVFNACEIGNPAHINDGKTRLTPVRLYQLVSG